MYTCHATLHAAWGEAFLLYVSCTVCVRMEGHTLNMVVSHILWSCCRIASVVASFTSIYGCVFWDAVYEWQTSSMHCIFPWSGLCSSCLATNDWFWQIASYVIWASPQTLVMLVARVRSSQHQCACEWVLTCVNILYIANVRDNNVQNPLNNEGTHAHCQV